MGRIAELEKGSVKDEWYLRTEDKAIYGPVGMKDLCEWSEQRRIGPEHELSKDRKNWVAAAEVSELGMEWMVDFTDGTEYGPLNLCAIREFMSEGMVVPDAKITNNKTKIALSGESILSSQWTAIMKDLHDSRLENRNIMMELDRLRQEKEILLKQLEEARQNLDISGGGNQDTALPPKAIRQRFSGSVK